MSRCGFQRYNVSDVNLIASTSSKLVTLSFFRPKIMKGRQIIKWHKSARNHTGYGLIKWFYTQISSSVWVIMTRLRIKFIIGSRCFIYLYYIILKWTTGIFILPLMNLIRSLETTDAPEVVVRYLGGLNSLLLLHPFH